MSKAVCVACRREIDAAARLCPYCGADPRTGEKIDTQTVIQEVFQPRKISTTEGLLEYARQRQGLVIAAAILLGFLLLGGLHQLITRRNQALSDATAVPLTEVADLNNQPEETKQLPMPQMQFQYDGHPQTMRNFVVEPGAVPPPQEVIDQLNAQQAERRARAAAAAERARNAAAQQRLEGTLQPPAAQAPTETNPQPTAQPPNQ
jgi:hypothetical protein